MYSVVATWVSLTSIASCREQPILNSITPLFKEAPDTSLHSAHLQKLFRTSHRQRKSSYDDGKYHETKKTLSISLRVSSSCFR